jgi:hypothetical protein
MELSDDRGYGIKVRFDGRLVDFPRRARAERYGIYHR